MTKEKLQEYALIAEIFGGIAIVISLIFVGIQIQQGTEETAINTAAIRTSSFQDLTGQVLGIYSNISTSERLAEIFYKANCRQELTPEENVQLGALAIAMVRHGAMSFQTYEQGLIDSQQLRAANAVLMANLTQAQYFYDLWQAMKITLSPGFISYTENVIAEIAPDGPLPSPWCQ